jgi:hypothetical protein
LRVLVRWPGDKVPATEFEHWVRSFLLAREDGSTLVIQHHGKPKALVRYLRSCSAGDSCVLEIEVLRTEVAERYEQDIASCADWWQLTPEHQSDDAVALVRWKYRVDDIWKTDSGAVGAGIARNYFERAGLLPGGRFDIRMTGNASTRVIQRGHARPS